MDIKSGFYRSVLKIAVPITLQSIIMALLQLTDQLMVGSLGEDTIAAVGIAGKLYSILSVVLVGIGTGVSIFAAQFWGKKDTQSIAQLLGLGLLAGGAFTLVFFTGVLCFPEYGIRLFTNDIGVISVGASFLFIISFSYMPTMLTIIYSAVLRSTGKVKLPMYASFAAVVINVILNYLLIFGHGFFPEMGAAGSATATVIARMIECALLIGCFYYYRLPGAAKPRHLLGANRRFAVRFMKMTYPLLLTELLWVLGETAYAIIYGKMSSASITAMTLSYPIQALSFGLLSGLAAAAGIMIGQLLGNGETDNAMLFARRFVKFGLSAAALLTVLIAVLSPLYLSAFHLSDDTYGFSIGVLWMFSAFFWVKAFNMIVAGGILNSGGDSKFVFKMEASSTWLIGIPLGLAAAFLFKLPVYWVYFFLSLEEVVRMIIGSYRLRSRRWIQHLAADA